MRITRIETFATQEICLVRVSTEDGLTGIGQTAPYNADITAQVLHRQVAPTALGADDGDIDALVDRAIKRQWKFPWSYVCRAACGLDTALWDLRGKREDKAVCELLGGSPGSVPVYASSMKRDIAPAQEAERMKRLQDERGYEAFKLHVMIPNSGDQDVYPGRTEEVIRLVRKAVGDEGQIYIDPNGAYTVEGAIEAAAMYQDYEVAFFEEPCPFWEIEQTARVAEAVTMPVAGGEQDNDMAQWRRMLAMEAVSIAQPDIGYAGGLSRLLRVAAMAERMGVQVTPHTANTSFLTIFGLHFMRSIANAFPYMENSIEDVPWVDGIFDPALIVADGQVAMPAGPGWGVTVRDSWLQGAVYQKSEAQG